MKAQQEMPSVKETEVDFPNEAFLGERLNQTWSMNVPTHTLCRSRIMRQLTKYTVAQKGSDLDHKA